LQGRIFRGKPGVCQTARGLILTDSTLIGSDFFRCDLLLQHRGADGENLDHVGRQPWLPW
jgi:hypothetical protein